MEKLVGRYSQTEEILNAITHGIGVILSIAGLCVLVAFASIKGSSMGIVSSAIFGASLIFAYTSSTLYHAINHEQSKQIFRQFDHSSIYFLIAGTYTPVVLVLLEGVYRWGIFLTIWFIAFFGIALKFIYPHRFKKFSMFLYLVMGWLIVIVINKLFEVMPSGGLWLMLLGGIFYTIGAVIYSIKKIPYNHAIWHLFVLAGSFSHYFMVLFYIVM